MRGDVAAHLDAEFAQKGLGDRADGHAGRGFARAGALEHVAHVVVAELLHAGEVGVARARQVHRGDLGVDRPGVHALFPVGVVAIGDRQRDRTAERPAVTNARDDRGAVLLDLHAAAAAVTELAAGEVVVDVVGRQCEAGRHAFDHGDQAGTVRFAGGCEAQMHCAQA